MDRPPELTLLDTIAVPVRHLPSELADHEPRVLVRAIRDGEPVTVVGRPGDLPDTLLWLDSPDHGD